MLAQTFGVLAVISSVVRAWPQAARIAMRRDTSGVSVLTWSLALSTSTSWIVFALGTGVLPALVANVMVASSALAILVVLQLCGKSVFQTVFPIAVLTAGMIVVSTAIMGPQGPGLVATVTSLVVFLPQVFTVFREDIGGVSPLTWMLILLSSLIWGIYGVLAQQWILVPATFVVVPAAVVVLLRIAGRSAVISSAPTPSPTGDLPYAS